MEQSNRTAKQLDRAEYARIMQTTIGCAQSLGAVVGSIIFAIMGYGVHPIIGTPIGFFGGMLIGRHFLGYTAYRWQYRRLREYRESFKRDYGEGI